MEGTEKRLEEEMREVEGWPRPIVTPLSLEETVRLRKEIYERDIRHKVEKTTWGRFAPSMSTPAVGPWETTGLFRMMRKR